MLVKHGNLYVAASGIWESRCGEGWKFEVYSGGELIVSEFARNEIQRQDKQAAIRQAFSGLPFYSEEV